MEKKQQIKLGEGFGALLGDTFTPTDTHGHAPEHGGDATRNAPANTDTDTGEDVETLLATVEPGLREALRARRFARAGRPRKGRALSEPSDRNFTRSTVDVRREYWAKVHEICLRETLTVREVMDMVLAGAIRRYEAARGVLSPSERKPSDLSGIFD